MYIDTSLSLYTYIYTYISIHMYLHIYIYIYVYKERENYIYRKLPGAPKGHGAARADESRGGGAAYGV